MAVNQSDKKYFVELVMEAIDGLDEIGGPDDAETYIAVLEEVKTVIDKRIENASANLETED